MDTVDEKNEVLTEEASDSTEDTNTATAVAEDDTAAKLARAEEALAYLAADFENYKRQTSRRLEEERQRAERRLLEQLLPALDNFNLALHHAGTAKDVDSLKIGLEFIAQQLEGALRGAGLEPIAAKGQKFDPTKHDAVEEVEAEGVESGTVLEESQRGWILGGQVLRPSRVKVAR
jgi:molecular chaperone GrpE